MIKTARKRWTFKRKLSGWKDSWKTTDTSWSNKKALSRYLVLGLSTRPRRINPQTRQLIPRSLMLNFRISKLAYCNNPPPQKKIDFVSSWRHDCHVGLLELDFILTHAIALFGFRVASVAWASNSSRGNYLEKNKLRPVSKFGEK